MGFWSERLPSRSATSPNAVDWLSEDDNSFCLFRFELTRQPVRSPWSTRQRARKCSAIHSVSLPTRIALGSPKPSYDFQTGRGCAVRASIFNDLTIGWAGSSGSRNEPLWNGRCWRREAVISRDDVVLKARQSLPIYPMNGHQQSRSACLKSADNVVKVFLGS